MGKDRNENESVLRLPPPEYKNMNTFDLVMEMFFKGDFMTCSQEVVDLIKKRLGIIGRKLTHLNSETAFLAGYSHYHRPQYDVDKDGNRTVIFLLVSPPEKSDFLLWYEYIIYAKDGGKTPYISLKYG